MAMGVARKTRGRWAALVLMSGVAVAVSACGSGTSSTVAHAAPGGGRLTFCTDATYPPEEFFQGSTLVGSDVEIANDVARRLGDTAGFANVGFDGIVSALDAGKCDAVISGMSDTPDRRRQVRFVDYGIVGQATMVPKGNPQHISGLDSLSGRSVGVQVGTTNRGFLLAASARLTRQGRAPIKVVVFPRDTDAVAALRTDKVDAYFSDLPSIAYYVKNDPDLFTMAPGQVHADKIAIAVKHADATSQASIQRAVDAMYADGTMGRILAKWNLSAISLRR